jgi:transposase
MEALRKLRLDQPHRQLTLQQDLDLMREINLRVQEDEKAISREFSDDEDYRLLLTVPGVGPVLAAVLVSEIDGIGRFASPKKLLGYAGLAPTTSSSGGRTSHGKMIRSCNKWLKWALVEAAWVAIGCDAYLGGIYRTSRARGKLANTSITIVASRMAAIIHRILTDRRAYQPFPPCVNQSPGGPALGLAEHNGG